MVYLIYKIDVESNKERPALVIDHTKTLSSALILLEKKAREIIEKNCGWKSSNDAIIMNAGDDSHVIEPLVDMVVMYRFNDNPHSIHLYQRKTDIVPGGYIFGPSTVTSFKKINVLYTDHYSGFEELGKFVEVKASRPIEMVKVGRGDIEVPKQMTISPISRVIDQLKTSDQFILMRKKLDESK